MASLFQCKNCKTRLEAGWVTKLLMILALPLGLALAGIAIWQEETGNCDSLDSQRWFFGVFIVIGLLSYLSWPTSKFKIKGDA